MAVALARAGWPGRKELEGRAMEQGLVVREAAADVVAVAVSAASKAERVAAAVGMARAAGLEPLRLYSVREMAALTGRTEDALRRMVRRGELKARRVTRRGHARVPGAVLAEFLFGQ